MQVFKQRTEQANTTFYVEGEGFGKEKRDQTESLFSPHYTEKNSPVFALLAGGWHFLYY